MIVHPIGSPAKDHIHHNSRSIMQKAPIGVRRRTRSKGTIAGFNTESSDPPPLTAENSSLDVSNHHPQHLLQGDAPPIPAKPSHNAKLALLCVQNANYMGARTQLHLCPPGKARDDLTKKLQEQRRRKKKALSVPNGIRRTGSFQRNSSVTSVKDDISVFEKLMGESGMKVYEDAEAEFLDNPTMHLRMMNEDGEECQEDPSSGDDDLLDFLFEEEKQNDDEQSLLEALYDGAAAQGQGSAKSGMLAFNFRKIKWFDSVTAADRAEAREYLKKELVGLKKRDALMLTSHLRKLQRREKRRLEIEQGRRTSRNSSNLDDWDDEEDAAIGMNTLPDNMTPSLAAALVLESLAMNPLESLEGMSKCYEGIVAAGSALLDMNEQSAGLKPTKKEIMNALTPLLITSLEQASGETILALSELRKMCGTKRYQRRFIQRIAPSLVRPPNAAMWCLRHQTDMKAILAATELIFESSSTIFSSDWFERGRSIVADAKRAESLNLAAMKLKKLSAPQQTENILSLTVSHHRRANSLNMATPAKHSSQSGSGTEMLAEWEILAVDREIRNSIKTVFDRDWSRINIRHAPPREGESPYPSKKPRGHTYEKKRNPSPVPPPPTSETDSPSELLSPPRVRKEKASNGAESAQQSPMSPKRTTRESQKKSIHRSPKSRSKSQRKEELPSPPQTPTEQKSPVVNSPVRPSPNKDYPSSEKITISPRPGQAPLSPVRTHHGINTNDTRTSSNSASASRAAQDTYLRNLTRTPADRKKTVAACRALRAQITRFENAFARVHGRPPKGAHERAPLATTYAQYREWKRAIRSDAASRIQSMYRGAHVRMMLKQNPTFRKIVEKRAGRPPKEPTIPPPIMPNDIISQQARSPRHPIPPLKPRGEKQDGSNGFGVEVVPYPADEQSLDYSEYTGLSSNVSYTPRAQEDSQNDLNYLTLPELSSLKRSLKQELKQYDMDFRAQYGRMPTKQEKEPIRSKYEKYNSLKRRISLVERDPSLVLPKPQPKSQGPRAPKIVRQETPPSAAVPPPQGPDLQALKNEKQHLHQMLRSYERDFFRINNRQVSSYNDIKPVASQYRRYKEIKKSILAMQQQGQRR